MTTAIASLLVVAGTAWVLLGISRQRDRICLPASDPNHRLGLACSLRAALVGGASAVAGVALFHDAPTVFGLACVIGGEELLETSVVIAALRADVARRMAPPLTRR